VGNRGAGTCLPYPGDPHFPPPHFNQHHHLPHAMLGPPPLGYPGVGHYYPWSGPPMEYISDVKPTDVLSGRGGATNSHCKYIVVAK
jgi:hypothetical protein